MELFFLIMFVVLFAYISWTMAESRGRNAPLAVLLSVLLSPLLVWAYLAFAGDTVEMKAQKLKELKDLVNS